MNTLTLNSFRARLRLILMLAGLAAAIPAQDAFALGFMYGGKGDLGGGVPVYRVGTSENQPIDNAARAAALAECQNNIRARGVANPNCGQGRDFPEVGEPNRAVRVVGQHAIGYWFPQIGSGNPRVFHTEIGDSAAEVEQALTAVCLNNAGRTDDGRTNVDNSRNICTNFMTTDFDTFGGRVNDTNCGSNTEYNPIPSNRALANCSCSTGAVRFPAGSGTCVSSCPGDRVVSGGTCACAPGFEDHDGTTNDLNDCRRICTGDMRNSANPLGDCICLDGMRLNDAGTMCIVDCQGDMEEDPNNAGSCRCPMGMEEDPNDTPNGCRVVCTGEMVRNTAGTACECPEGQEPEDGTVNGCQKICTDDMENNPTDTDQCICINRSLGPDTTTPDDPNDCTAIISCEGRGDLRLNPLLNQCVCPAGEIPNEFTPEPDDCRPDIAACKGDMELRNIDSVVRCACPAHIPVTDLADNTRCLPNCNNPDIYPRGSVPAEDRTTCRCPDGLDQRAYQNNAPTEGNPTTRFCALPRDMLSDGLYTTDNCTNRGWATDISVDAGNRVRIVCMIPVAISTVTVAENNAAALVAASAGSPRTQQTNPGDTLDGCILTEHSGFTPVGNAPNVEVCEDEDLFGTHGLPAIPAGFNVASERLLLTPATGDGARALMYNGEQITDRATSVGGGGGGGGGNTGGGGGGTGGGGGGNTGGGGSSGGGAGVGAAGLAIFTLVGAFFLSGDGGLDPAAFAFSPETSFSFNDGVAHYSYGTRIDYREDALTAYWAANQSGRTGSDDDPWRYASGLNYEAGILRASFDGINYERTTELNFGLAAEYRTGIYRLESGINADYRLDEYGTEGGIYANTGATLEYKGWEIKPSANLFWRQGESLGDNARFRLNVRREF